MAETGGGDYVKSNFSKTFPSEWVAVRGRGSVDILWARSREKEIHKKGQIRRKKGVEKWVKPKEKMIILEEWWSISKEK